MGGPRLLCGRDPFEVLFVSNSVHASEELSDRTFEVIRKVSPCLVVVEEPNRDVDSDDVLSNLQNAMSAAGYEMFESISHWCWLKQVEGESVSDLPSDRAIPLGSRNEEFSSLCLMSGSDVPSRHSIGFFTNDDVNPRAGWSPVPMQMEDKTMSGVDISEFKMQPFIPMCSGGGEGRGDDLPVRYFESKSYVNTKKGVACVSKVSVLVLHPQITHADVQGLDFTRLLVFSPTCGARVDTVYVAKYTTLSKEGAMSWGSDIEQIDPPDRDDTVNRLWVYGGSNTALIKAERLLVEAPSMEQSVNQLTISKSLRDHPESITSQRLVRTSNWIVNEDGEPRCVAVLLESDAVGNFVATSKCVIAYKNQGPVQIRAYLQLPLRLPFPYLPFDDQSVATMVFKGVGIDIKQSDALPQCTQCRISEITTGGEFKDAREIVSFINKTNADRVLRCIETDNPKACAIKSQLVKALTSVRHLANVLNVSTQLVVH